MARYRVFGAGHRKHFVLPACRQPGSQSKKRFKLLICGEIFPPYGSSRSVEKHPNTAIIISKKYNDFSTNTIVGENDKILEQRMKISRSRLFSSYRAYLLPKHACVTLCFCVSRSLSGMNGGCLRLECQPPQKERVPSRHSFLTGYSIYWNYNGHAFNQN